MGDGFESDERFTPTPLPVLLFTVTKVGPLLSFTFSLPLLQSWSSGLTTTYESIVFRGKSFCTMVIVPVASCLKYSQRHRSYSALYPLSRASPDLLHQPVTPARWWAPSGRPVARADEGHAAAISSVTKVPFAPGQKELSLVLRPLYHFTDFGVREFNSSY